MVVSTDGVKTLCSWVFPVVFNYGTPVNDNASIDMLVLNMIDSYLNEVLLPRLEEMEKNHV